jgi:hypothetical protein
MDQGNSKFIQNFSVICPSSHTSIARVCIIFRARATLTSAKCISGHFEMLVLSDRNQGSRIAQCGLDDREVGVRFPTGGA